MLARIAVTLGVAMGMGALATDAVAASLSLTVSPAFIHPGQRYTVTINGRYNKRARHQAPYLVAFTQYSGKACKSTAPAEYSLPASMWAWDVYPRAERSARFKSTTYWKASSRTGSRRICAYLYPGRVGPKTTAKPLASAGLTGAAFRVTRS